MSSFYEYITEGSLPWDFKLTINSDIYEIIRTIHLRDKRGNDPKPKDFKMSKSKYKKLIELSINKITKNIAYTITWTFNNKSNAISLEKEDNKLYVFGAIMNSSGDYSKLYKKAQHRIHLGDVQI